MPAKMARLTTRVETKVSVDVPRADPMLGSFSVSRLLVVSHSSVHLGGVYRDILCERRSLRLKRLRAPSTAAEASGMAEGVDSNGDVLVQSSAQGNERTSSIKVCRRRSAVPYQQYLRSNRNYSNQSATIVLHLRQVKLDGPH